jgi:hypothetical protein
MMNQQHQQFSDKLNAKAMIFRTLMSFTKALEALVWQL